MLDNNKRKRRQRLYYSDISHPQAYLSEKKKVTRQSVTMSGAQRAATDRVTGAAIPSDEAVDEMRGFSEENRL